MAEKTPENPTILQGFEWNCPADGKHYDRLKAQISQLKQLGIANIWLPPGCKASGPEGNGYDIYDLYDLGEFDQKGSRRTKWGSKESLLSLSETAKDAGIGLYWDAVLNHKAGADSKEKCIVVEVDNDDRNKKISEPYEITAWLGFDFAGRGDKYSKLKYHWWHFIGTDWDAATEKSAIFQIQGDGKRWSDTVSDENGNGDYLMFADVDYHDSEVQEDVKRWGSWIVKEVGLAGFRLDAVQHYSQRFTNEWVEQVNKETGRKLFYVGEYWHSDAQNLCDWLDGTEHEMSLYDSALLGKFASIGEEGEKGDLRGIFDDTLVKQMPVNAVTLVQNHDTQKGQTVETPVAGWMKPLAHALILLRQEGYPCVFFGDLYGIKGQFEEGPSCGGKLPDLIRARTLYAYGDQEDYWDQPNCVGFVRRGTEDRKDGLACMMSNAAAGEIRMHVGKEHAGEVWTDVLQWQDGEVIIDGEGAGLFTCPRAGLAVWVNKDAQGRDTFPVKFDVAFYK